MGMMISDIAKERLAKIAADVGDLPAAPAVLSRAMTLTSDLNSNIRDISRILADDQSLTAKVLRLSNSPYYGRTKEVTTLHEAITVMGFMAVRSIIVVASVHEMYEDGDEDCPHKKLWRHSLSTAIAGRLIAKYLGHPEREEAFIGGLMHDIGKLVLLDSLSEWYLPIIDEVERDGVSFSVVESRVLLFDHADVALPLLKQWSFPLGLVRAITLHHRPPSFAKGTVAPVAHVVNLANLLAKKLRVGFRDERIERLEAAQSARLLFLDEDALQKILIMLERDYQTEIKLFE